METIVKGKIYYLYLIIFPPFRREMAYRASSTRDNLLRI